MIFADNLLSPELQYGAFALCALLIGVLALLVRGLLRLLGRERKQNEKLSDRNKEQSEIINNHLVDVYRQLIKINSVLDGLPCHDAGECTEESE